jgi:hypothetical protein
MRSVRLISQAKFLGQRSQINPGLTMVCAVLLAGCAHPKTDPNNPPVKKEWNNVHFGPAKYNRNTSGFEDPWPFGPGP